MTTTKVDFMFVHFTVFSRIKKYNHRNHEILRVNRSRQSILNRFRTGFSLWSLLYFLLSPRTYSRRQIQTVIHTVRTAYSINISPSQTDSLQNRRFDGRIKDRRPQHLAVLISTHAYLFSQHFYFLNRWLLVDRCELGSLLSQYWYQTDRSNTRLCSNKKNMTRMLRLVVPHATFGSRPCFCYLSDCTDHKAYDDYRIRIEKTTTIDVCRVFVPHTTK